MSKKKHKSRKKKVKKSQSYRSALRFEAGFWSKHWLPALIVSILAVALYIRGVDYEFVLDDQIVITENEFTKSGLEGLDEIFTTESFQGYFGEQKNLVAGSRYRPLSLATFAVQYEFHGLDTTPYHIGNILFYLITALIAMRLFYLFLPPPKSNPWFFSAAFMAGIFFVAHPVHTEVVANIKGRDEIMSLLFALASLYFTLRHLEFQRWLDLLWMSICFMLGLLAKENAITFLAVVPLAFWFYSKSSFNRYMKTLWPLLVVAVLYLFIRYSVIGYLLDSGNEIMDPMNNPFVEMTTGQFSSTVLFTLGEYIRLLFFPHPLVHDYYPYAVPIMNWGDWRVLLSFAIYTAMILFALWGIRKRKISSFAILYYLATLSIVSNIVIPVGTFMNERFLFMPSFGFCLLLGYILGKGSMEKLRFQPFGYYLGIGLFALTSIGYVYKTFDRVSVWKNPLTLNRSAVKVSQNSARANVFMGTALYNKMKEVNDRELERALLDSATFYIDRALTIFPKYGNDYSEHWKYGNAFQMKAGVIAEQYKNHRNLDSLLQGFKYVIRNKPGTAYIGKYLEYLNNQGQHRERLKEFYIDVGYRILFREQDKKQFALKYLNYGLSLDQDDPVMLYATGQVLLTMGEHRRGQTFVNRARQLNPNIDRQF